MKIGKYDIILNYVGTFVSMFSNFLILPFMLAYMRSDTLGLWYVYLSIGGIVTLFDFGFNPTIARNISFCWNGAKDIQKTGVSVGVNKTVDYKLFSVIWKTCKVIYFIIAFVGLICLLTGGSIYIANISSNIKDSNVWISWCIYCVGIFMNLYFGYYATILRGVGAIAQLNLSIIISRLMQLIVSTVMLFMHYDILAVAAGYFLYGLVYRILAKQFLIRYQNIGINVKNYISVIKYSELLNNFKIMWYNAWRDGIVSVSTYVCNQALTMILAVYFSLEETGGYSLVVQIVTALVTVASTLYTAYQPSLQAFYLKNDKEELKKIMSKVMVIYWAIVISGMVILIFLGKVVIAKIKPELNISVVMIILVGIYQILLKRQAVYASYISNMNQVIYMKSFFIFGITAIGAAWLVAANLYRNIYVLILIQIAVQALYNNWHWSGYVKKILATTSREMFIVGVKEIKKIFKINNEIQKF